MNKLTILLASTTLLFLSGCANMSQGEQRMWSGAAIGGTVAGPVGAAVGAGTGYVVSKLEKDEK